MNDIVRDILKTNAEIAQETARILEGYAEKVMKLADINRRLAGALTDATKDRPEPNHAG